MIWSHEIDNVSGSLSTDELNATRSGQRGGNILNKQGNVQQNKATGDFDRTHRLVVSDAYGSAGARSGFLRYEPQRALVEYQEYLNLAPKGEYAAQVRELIQKLSQITPQSRK
jgi:hypothetical protein